MLLFTVNRQNYQKNIVKMYEGLSSNERGKKFPSLIKSSDLMFSRMLKEQNPPLPAFNNLRDSFMVFQLQD